MPSDYLVIVFPPANSGKRVMEFGRDSKKTPFRTKEAAKRKAKSLRAKYPPKQGYRVRVGWWT